MRRPEAKRHLALAIALLTLGTWSLATAQVDPTTGFELDKNIVDDPTLTPNDWTNLNCSAIGGSTADFKTGAIPDPSPLTIYTQGGSKDRNDVTEWRYTNGSVPDKDEITNAYAARYTISGETIIYLGGDRHAVNGSAFIGAWFFQNAVGLGPDGHFIGEHEDGDILILAEFVQGGGQANQKVFSWVGDDPSACPAGKLDGAGTLCDITPAAFPVTAIGFSNDLNQTIPANCSADWPYDPKSGPDGRMLPNAFFEVGINFTALGVGSECFASFLLETRSSHEVDAQLKDFVLHSFQPCGIDCQKTVEPAEVCEGSSVTYTHAVSNIPNGAAITISLKDDNGTPANASDDFYICFPANLDGTCKTQANSCTSSLGTGQTLSCTRTVTPSAGTHINTETATVTSPPGVEGCADDATVVVNPNPSVSINQFTCTAPAASFSLTATPSGGTAPYDYLWNTGDTGATIVESVGGQYSVTVTDAKGCVADACRPVGYCTGTNCGP